MDLQDLTAFIEVAESGSFSRAAEVLHLTQPAVSKRVAALEQRIGRPLLDRVARRVTLTDAGHALLPYARAALQCVEDGRRALSHLSDHVSGRLTIGISHHIGLHHLPPVLKRFATEYPQVDLDIHFMDSEIACHDVLAGKLELGIVTLPSEPIAHLEQRTVWPDPLAVVVAQDHPLAQRPKVKLSHLAEYPAVLPDETTYTHRIIKAALHRHGLTPRIRLATNYLETLKILVAIGLGWSVLPLSMVDDSLRVLKLPELSLHRDLGVVWHEKRTLSSAARRLLHDLHQ